MPDGALKSAALPIKFRVKTLGVKNLRLGSYIHSLLGKGKQKKRHSAGEKTVSLDC